MRRLIGLSAAGLTLAIALEAGAIGPGDPAPDFSLQDIQGNSIALSDYPGHVVLLALIGYG
ncbi:MAG TPA: redoxin domain-containing protein [Candidatus Krumholzibacteria bacterium]|nr:redoxin domain-containing protein [Candidatus Krumholzibacteria bacterium]